MKGSSGDSSSLSFSSGFESGNLLLVVLNAGGMFELYMQNDVNTKGCTQWFYFSVVNRVKGKVVFRIMNFVIFVLCSTSRPPCIRRG